MDTHEDNERLLELPRVAPDTDAALARFRAAVAATGARQARGVMPPALLGRTTRWVALAAGVIALLTGLTMTGVADSILQIFEAKQVTAVTVTATDVQALEGLSAYGTLTWSAKPAPHPAASLAAAAAETGLPAPTVTLPAGVAASAHYGVLARTSATFVFDAAKAGASAAAIGRTAPPMPAKIDGSTLVYTGGPALIETYGDPDRDGGGLVVIVGRAPTVSSDGVSLADLRAYLLAQPGISPALAAQIRAIGDPATTLPVPIPAGQASAKNVRVHGVTGVFVGDSTGLGSGVIWVQEGLVYAVGGTLTEAQTLAVANSLR